MRTGCCRSHTACAVPLRACPLSDCAPHLPEAVNDPAKFHAGTTRFHTSRSAHRRPAPAGKPVKALVPASGCLPQVLLQQCPFPAHMRLNLHSPLRHRQSPLRTVQMHFPHQRASRSGSFSLPLHTVAPPSPLPAPTPATAVVRPRRSFHTIRCPAAPLLFGILWKNPAEQQPYGQSPSAKVQTAHGASDKHPHRKSRRCRTVNDSSFP